MRKVAPHIAKVRMMRALCACAEAQRSPEVHATPVRASPFPPKRKRNRVPPYGGVRAARSLCQRLSSCLLGRERSLRDGAQPAMRLTISMLSHRFSWKAAHDHYIRRTSPPNRLKFTAICAPAMHMPATLPSPLPSRNTSHDLMRIIKTSHPMAGRQVTCA